MRYEDQRVYIQCDCYSHEHLLVVELGDFSSEDRPDHMLSFGIQMNHYLPWWKRVWVAIRYIAGAESIFGHWDSVIVPERKAAELKRLIDDYITRTEG